MLHIVEVVTFGDRLPGMGTAWISSRDYNNVVKSFTIIISVMGESE